MQRKHFIWLFMASLLITSLACAFLGGDETEVATEAPPVEVKPTDVPLPEPTEEPELEESTIDTLQLWNSSDISSFRGEFTISFQGTTAGEPTQGSMSMFMETTSEPLAQHFTLSMQGLDLGEELEGLELTDMEFYMVDNTMYANMGMGMGWLKFPGMSIGDIEDMVIMPDDFVDMPPSANRKLLPETVNGVSCWHFVLDDPSLLGEATDFDTFMADAWIAVEGGYLVKMEVEATGDFTDDFGETISLEEGSMNIVFDLLSVNEDFTIVVPDEALAAEDFGLGTGSFGEQEWTREDVPLTADASVDLVMEGTVFFYTDLSVEEAANYMTGQLVANGWIEGSNTYVSEDSYFGDFSKDDETLTLMLNPNTDGTSYLTSGYLAIQ